MLKSSDVVCSTRQDLFRAPAARRARRLIERKVPRAAKEAALCCFSGGRTI